MTEFYCVVLVGSFPVWVSRRAPVHYVQGRKKRGSFLSEPEPTKSRCLGPFGSQYLTLLSFRRWQQTDRLSPDSLSANGTIPSHPSPSSPNALIGDPLLAMLNTKNRYPRHLQNFLKNKHLQPYRGCLTKRIRVLVGVSSFVGVDGCMSSVRPDPRPAE